MKMNSETQNTSVTSSNEEINVANGFSREANEVSQEETAVINEDESDHDFNGGLDESTSSTGRSLHEPFHNRALRLPCVWNRGNDAFAYGRTERCPFCGKNLPQTGVSNEEFATSSAYNHEALHLTFASGMQSVPQTHETPHEVQAASTTNSANIDTRAGGPVIQSGNVPVEGFSDSSVLFPCPPQQLKLFVLKEHHPLLNEMTFSVHCVEHSMQGSVGSIVRQLERHRGTRFQVVPFGEEYYSQGEHKHFHTVNIENEIHIRFELRMPIQGKFRLRLEQEITQVCQFKVKQLGHSLTNEFRTKIFFKLNGSAFSRLLIIAFFFTHFKQVSLDQIMSLGQNRIPSSVARVHVEPLGEPGEICQDHLRMIIDYGRTSQRMLIPIWSARPSESR